MKAFFFCLYEHLRSKTSMNRGQGKKTKLGGLRVRVEDNKVKPDRSSQTGNGAQGAFFTPHLLFALAGACPRAIIDYRGVSWRSTLPPSSPEDPSWNGFGRPVALTRDPPRSPSYHFSNYSLKITSKQVCVFLNCLIHHVVGQEPLPRGGAGGRV